MNLVGFLFVYGYFAFGFADDSATCLASSDSDKRIDEDSVDSRKGQDMSWNFRFGFGQLFLVTLVQAVGFSLNHMYIDDDERRRPFMIYIVIPSVIWGFVCWGYLFVNRLDHRGKVCCGDFLEDGQSEEGYLIETGLFIQFIALLLVLPILLIIAFWLSYVLALLYLVSPWDRLYYERTGEIRWETIRIWAFSALAICGFLLFSYFILSTIL